MGCGSSTASASSDEGARRPVVLNAEIEGKPSATDAKPAQHRQDLKTATSNSPETVTPKHDSPRGSPVSSTINGVTTAKPPSPPLPPISSNKQENNKQVQQDPIPRGESPTEGKIAIAVSTHPTPPLGQFLEQQQALGIASTCSDRICDLYDLCKGAAADGHSNMSIESFRHLGELYHKDLLFSRAQFLVWWDLNVHQHVRINEEEFGMYLADLAWRASCGDHERAKSKGLPLVLDTLMKKLQTSSLPYRYE